MTDYTDLVKRLRAPAYDWNITDTAHEAAAAIEALTAERDAARAETWEAAARWHDQRKAEWDRQSEKSWSGRDIRIADMAALHHGESASALRSEAKDAMPPVKL